MFKIFNKKDKDNLRIVYIASFFVSIASALPAYIQSSFIEQKAGASSVGPFFVGAYLITLIITIFLSKLVKKLGCYRGSVLIGAIFLVSLLGATFSGPYWGFFVSFAGIITASTVVYACLDVLIEKFSDHSSMGQSHTVYMTSINLAWILSPSIASVLIGKGGYGLVYIVSSILVIPFIAIMAANFKSLRDKKEYRDEKVEKTFRKMFGNKNRRGIFILFFLLNLFYNSAVVFLPIHLQNLGFTWNTLGWMFSIMLLPFVIFEIPAGIIADKYLGEKEMLSAGFLILVLSLLIFFSFNSINPFWWAAILFFSRIGASLIEAMCLSYFSKQVSDSDVAVINLFRTPISLGYLVGSLISSVMALFLPINFIFLLLAIIMLSSFPVLMTIKDTK